jgi:hypothetical protein
MIANAQRHMPDTLKLDADQKFFRAGLAASDVCAHGRHSHEGGTDAAQRKRLILTRRIASLEPDPTHAKALLWNPAGADFALAWETIGGGDGVLAIVGGTDVFGLFLEIGYDAFHLSHARHAHVPGGRPVFPQVPTRTPEEVLASYGLKPDPEQVLDSGATLVTWRRDGGRR